MTGMMWHRTGESGELYVGIDWPSSTTTKKVPLVQPIGSTVRPEPTHVNAVAHLDAKVTSPGTAAFAMVKPPTS